MKQNIFNSLASAIVCPANCSLSGGAGLDGVIRSKLNDDLALPNQLTTGDAVLTDAPGLSFNHIIHVAAPIWKGGQHNETSLLARSYQSIIKTCIDHDIKSVAIPALSTGAYGFPSNIASKIASKETANRSVDIELYDSRGSKGSPDDFVVYHCCGNQWEIALHPLYPSRLDWFPVCECGISHSPAYQMPSFVQ
jgi:O-acetyl-ADP-ribose deacetylase (regulator of RNase III)